MDPGQVKVETRLQAAECYGVLGNAQGEVGDLAARKGKGLASSASARSRAAHAWCGHCGGGEIRQRRRRERGRRARLGDRLGHAVVN